MLVLYKNFGWEGWKSAMGDATKTTARPIGHMTYTQILVICEKNIFHLFSFTQPVKNYSFFSQLFLYIVRKNLM